jgi:mRNA-degrading endonuclease RelE of RelBE toxin-antitoxin system
MPLRVWIGRKAQKEIDALPVFHRRNVVRAIFQLLSEDPFVEGGKKKLLRGVRSPWRELEPVWRLRVGDFRVFYGLREGLVSVEAVRHKGRKTTEEIL